MSVLDSIRILRRLRAVEVATRAIGGNPVTITWTDDRPRKVAPPLEPRHEGSYYGWALHRIISANVPKYDARRRRDPLLAIAVALAVLSVLAVVGIGMYAR